jgi:NAD(P)-dependent dehydrogenase (short-subunit alcohol dehydrogenase family)
MPIDLKPLDQQVIVITGASSGIGLATARTAASKGAKVVLAARSGATLKEIVRPKRSRQDVDLGADAGAGEELGDVEGAGGAEVLTAEERALSNLAGSTPRFLRSWCLGQPSAMRTLTSSRCTDINHPLPSRAGRLEG